MIVERTIKMTKEEEKAIKIAMKVIEDMSCELGLSTEEIFCTFNEMPLNTDFNGVNFTSQSYDDYEIEVKE